MYLYKPFFDYYFYHIFTLLLLYVFFLEIFSFQPFFFKNYLCKKIIINIKILSF